MPGRITGELFAERYEVLLGWALRLTGRDHQRAEDLVHDTFVQFVLSRPDLSAIENLDGYL
jgi:DNA-directed RNA polymerase specialized sigma24 family protein